MRAGRTLTGMNDEKAPPGRFSLERRENRVVWAVILAVISEFIWYGTAVPLLIGVGAYVLLTAIVTAGRR